MKRHFLCSALPVRSTTVGILRDIFGLGVIGFLTVGTASAAATQTWTGSAGATWDAGTTASWNSPTTWTDGNTAAFNATGAEAIIISSGAGGAVTTGNIGINADGYTFSGDPLSVAGTITLASGINSEFDDNLTLGTASAVVLNGGTLTLTGGGTFGTSSSAIALSGTSGSAIDFTSGAYAFSDGAAVSQSSATSNVTLNFSGTSSFTTANAQFAIGYSGTAAVNYSSSATSTFNNLLVLGRAGNATLTQTNGTIDVVDNSGLAVQVGNANGLTGELDLQGGAFTVSGGTSAAILVNHGNTGTGTLIVEGGTLTTPILSLLPASGGTASLSMSSGAINTDSLTTSGAGTSTITLTGGVLGTSTSTNATWAPNIILGSHGNVSIRAATAAGASANITLSGALTGSGGFTKTGAGQLTLSNTGNTYSGPTLVSAGTLSLASTGGSVEVGATGTLILTLNTALVASSTLTLDAGASAATDGYAELNFTGIDTIAGLTVDGTVLGPGIYNSSNLSDFSGTGSLDVVEAPEPTTWTMLAGGFFVLVMWQRRRQS